MKNTEDITFEEFAGLCEEAGISTDNPEQMEQDFRAGKALADVTDELITDQELHPGTRSTGEYIEAMDLSVTMLEEGSTVEANRKLAIKLAVSAIRYLAECCYDEGQN